MKKKQKDDILGEEETNLPVNDGMARDAAGYLSGLLRNHSAWWMSERDLRFQEGVFLSAADAECG